MGSTLTMLDLFGKFGAVVCYLPHLSISVGSTRMSVAGEPSILGLTLDDDKGGCIIPPGTNHRVGSQMCSIKVDYSPGDKRRTYDACGDFVNLEAQQFRFMSSVIQA